VDTNVPQKYAAFIFNICPEQRIITPGRNVGIHLQQYDHILSSHHGENLKNFMIIFTPVQITPRFKISEAIVHIQM
jgi:hypothetical protein